MNFTHNQYNQTPIKFLEAKTEDKGILNLNLNNIGFIKINKEEDNVTYLSLTYRIKASLKEKIFKLFLPRNDVSKYLAKYNFYKLEKYYLNVNNILFFETEQSDNKVDITCYFSDGQVLNLTTEKGRWESWKQTRLK